MGSQFQIFKNTPLPQGCALVLKDNILMFDNVGDVSLGSRSIHWGAGVVGCLIAKGL